MTFRINLSVLLDCLTIFGTSSLPGMVHIYLDSVCVSHCHGLTQASNHNHNSCSLTPCTPVPQTEEGIKMEGRKSWIEINTV